MSAESKKNQHLRRVKKALRHAEARKRSAYRVARIKGYLKSVEQGERHTACPERLRNQAAAAAAQKTSAMKKGLLKPSTDGNEATASV